MVQNYVVFRCSTGNLSPFNGRGNAYRSVVGHRCSACLVRRQCFAVEIQHYVFAFGNIYRFGSVFKQCNGCIGTRSIYCCLQGNVTHSANCSNVTCFVCFYGNVAFFVHFCYVSHKAFGKVTVMYRRFETSATDVERRCLVGHKVAHYIARCATVDGAYTAVVLTAVNYRSDFVIGHVVVRPTDYLTCEVSAVKFGITPVLHRLVGCRECSAVYRQSAEFVVLYGNGSSRNKFATVNGKYGVLSVGSFVGIVPAVVYQR